MSKSLGNYVGITEAPNDIFSKLMSISDELMWRYIDLLSFAPRSTTESWKKEVASGRNPREIKVEFAKEIVARFHSAAAARNVSEAGLPRNFKEALRKCYATLRRDDLHHELNVAERPDAVKERVETFFELHHRRAQAPIATKHPDVFVTERSRSFLREYLARASEAGLAKVFELLVDGEVVASRIGFVLDDSLYLYFSGYLPKMSRYSVMTTCTVEAIKWAIAKGFQTINLSTGRDQSKLRWRPTEVSLIEAQVVSPSWRGAVFHEFNYAVKQRVPEVAALPGGLGLFVKLIKRRQ